MNVDSNSNSTPKNTHADNNTVRADAGLAMPYRDFYHARETLADIEPIDYFLAASIIDDIQRGLSVANEQTIDAFTSAQCRQLCHLLMALSQHQRFGHSCLPLADVAQQQWFDTYQSANTGQLDDEQASLGFRFADIDTLQQLCQRLFGTDHEQALVVFEHQALYLRRYWHFECEVAEFIKHHVNVATHIDATQQKAIIDTLFASHCDSSVDIDWQKLSVANALNRALVVIAGGPGTGKTYTVTKLLLALLMQQSDLHIAMVAPTGKAAQRLSESIIKATDDLQKQSDLPADLLAKMPRQASTIHRLLGVQHQSPNFKHNQNNPLSCDVLLIDEVSMVDLAMMARIFRALKANTKLIMLGDANQLPSVATGSVLADIAPFGETRLSGSNAAHLEQLISKSLQPYCQKPAIDYLTYLTLSRRFKSDGGIGQLAKYVIQSQADKAWSLLTNGEDEELALEQKQDLVTFVRRLTERYYQPIQQSGDLDEAFRRLDAFRFLTPTRQGEQGVEAINVLVEQHLVQKKLILDPQKPYHGKPIMISENHYASGLFNGDIGIIWQDETKRLAAYFVEEQGYKKVSLSRLPAYETVYAMTIHKTQGSEFNHVAMFVDDPYGRLLSRELLYTGITRAKKHLVVYAKQSTFEQAVGRQVRRASRLSTRLLSN
ncbi:exodeoxyribonuclease V subunit alpha [Thalassotalea maritima]|uniref:exodeoxyribonuclease V subunit alpha n=1 Tax=Thalassotalea maritima TaxID=3242416 RepID=UPI003528526D